MGALSDGFGDLMETTVVVTNPSTAARTITGAASYASAASTYRAHVLDTNDRVTTRDGTEVEVSTVAWVASTVHGSITDRSRVRLSDGRRPPVRRVDEVHDQAGIHHIKIYMGA